MFQALRLKGSNSRILDSKKIMSRGLGIIQQKVLLLLLGGLALGLSGSPRRYFRVLDHIGKEWKKIDQRALHDAIRRLYASHLIDARDNPDGSITMLLSANGKKRALSFQPETLKIAKPLRWDRKWRVISFDIPETKRKIRNAFRRHLRQLDFYELQKSVFIHPYPCEDEIEFLIELHQIRPFVRQLYVERIDNELHLKKVFNLL